MKGIDLFAGAGGFTLGAEMAGVRVVWAGNHWPLACDVFEANHGLKPACQDLHQQDWTQVPEHDVAFASPSCQGHARARGTERPHHDAARSTAWAVVSALECHRTPIALIENVPEFMQWVLYPAWCAALEALGYSIAPHIVDTADLGVPQNRVRVFIALTRSRNPIRLDLPQREHVPATDILDFDAGRWSRIDKPGRAPATLARVANGRRDHGERFLIAYYGATKGGRSIERPIGTITTRDRWALIDGDRMRMLSVAEARRAMTFPDDYTLPDNSRDAMHLLGNAVPPTAAREVVAALLGAA